MANKPNKQLQQSFEDYKRGGNFCSVAGGNGGTLYPYVVILGRVGGRGEPGIDKTNNKSFKSNILTKFFKILDLMAFIIFCLFIFCLPILLQYIS